MQAWLPTHLLFWLFCCWKNNLISSRRTNSRVSILPLDGHLTSAWRRSWVYWEPISSQSISNIRELSALCRISFTILITFDNTSCSSGDIFFATSYSRCIMQCVDRMSGWLTFFTLATTPERCPAMFAAPSTLCQYIFSIQFCVLRNTCQVL